ncbi:L,D-transpeptidase [Actibacterium sp. MT2.3-13A]|uniref:L,D-transpeptidase n=1 Tax=Actibacterium sp. MT2.3-13A TaxID=2828332 RepID=UPI001BAAE706|nr:L,D-transpeptidase [Actibacterium sp. MT2.3-13A]
MSRHIPSRRAVLTGLAAALATPSILRAETREPLIRGDEGVRRNASSFIIQRWEDHFETLGKAAIVADTTSRALHFWSGDGSDYRLYPTSVPMSEDLTRRGYTEIVRKRVGPDWHATQDMIKRDPDIPRYMPPGPGNPLGTHAMYLSWPAYLIHGTHDTRKIGRRSSSGCIGLYNSKIAELFEIAPIGTQVRLI